MLVPTISLSIFALCLINQTVLGFFILAFIAAIIDSAHLLQRTIKDSLKKAQIAGLNLLGQSLHLCWHHLAIVLNNLLIGITAVLASGISDLYNEDEQRTKKSSKLLGRILDSKNL